jgi:hypothetical protein
VKRLEVLKALVVAAAFLAPIAVAAGVSREPVLESPRALVVALGAAWVAAALVGYGFYGGKRCLGAATLLLAAALAVLVACARPWVGEGVEENVVFWYAASFTYENSADNLPIENVLLSFPHPNIDNEPVPIMDFSWSLWGSNRENMVLQIQDGNVITFVGNRSAPLLVQYGRENTPRGPKISFSVDKLYPHEILGFTAYVLTSSDRSESLTLYESKDNQKICASYYYQPSNKVIKLIFSTQLFRKIDDNFKKIEAFSRVDENAQPFEWSVWLKLYPVD